MPYQFTHYTSLCKDYNLQRGVCTGHGHGRYDQSNSSWTVSNLFYSQEMHPNAPIERVHGNSVKKGIYTCGKGECRKKPHLRRWNLLYVRIKREMGQITIARGSNLSICSRRKVGQYKTCKHTYQRHSTTGHQ